MADPFAAALAALHSAAGSVAAIYTPGSGGDPLPIRVIREQPSRDYGGLERIVADTNIIVIRRTDVAAPARGDLVQIGSEALRLNAAPMLDVEGISWSCPAEPA